MSTCVDCVTSSGSTCTKWRLSFHGPCHQRRAKSRKRHARPSPCSKCRSSPSKRAGGLTFLTSFFLHAGVLHLVGNIYFLFVFGDDVENFLRPFRYLALIAVAAFIGDLAHIAADPHSQIPCIGASGGIAGVITFYALNFPKVKLEFLLRYGWWWFRWIRLRAWFVFVLWILFQAVGAWEQVAGISAVSSLAHLGGAVVGFVAWLLWRKNNRATEASRL